MINWIKRRLFFRLNTSILLQQMERKDKKMIQVCRALEQQEHQISKKLLSPLQRVGLLQVKNL